MHDYVYQEVHWIFVASFSDRFKTKPSKQKGKMEDTTILSLQSDLNLERIVVSLGGQETKVVSSPERND
jgi:hypothetical protein